MIYCSHSGINRAMAIHTEVPDILVKMVRGEVWVKHKDHVAQD